jgi:hypothetical protein
LVRCSSVIAAVVMGIPPRVTTAFPKHERAREAHAEVTREVRYACCGTPVRRLVVRRSRTISVPSLSIPPRSFTALLGHMGWARIPFRLALLPRSMNAPSRPDPDAGANISVFSRAAVRRRTSVTVAHVGGLFRHLSPRPVTTIHCELWTAWSSSSATSSGTVIIASCPVVSS